MGELTTLEIGEEDEEKNGKKKIREDKGMAIGTGV